MLNCCVDARVKTICDLYVIQGRNRNELISLGRRFISISSTIETIAENCKNEHKEMKLEKYMCKIMVVSFMVTNGFANSMIVYDIKESPFNKGL